MGTPHPKSPLNYTEASRVGMRLCTRWAALTGKNPPVMQEEAWADVVQFVLRHAAGIMDGRELRD